jgi:hypothetical protein
MQRTEKIGLSHLPRRILFSIFFLGKYTNGTERKNPKSELKKNFLGRGVAPLLSYRTAKKMSSKTKAWVVCAWLTVGTKPPSTKKSAVGGKKGEKGRVPQGSRAYNTQSRLYTTIFLS